MSLVIRVPRVKAYVQYGPADRGLKSGTAVALAQTAVSACLWGTSFPVIAVAIAGGLDPIVFVFLRFLVAAPLMLLAAVLLKKRVWALLRDKGVWVVAFFNAVGFLSQFVGQQFTGAAIAALLVNLSVIFAAIGGTALLGERLGTYKAIGVALAFIGTFLVASGGDLSTLNGGQLTGGTLYLLAALSWAGYIIYAKEKGDKGDWDPVAVAACIVTLTALFLVPALAFVRGPFPFSPGAWAAIAFTAGANTALPFVLYQAGLRRLTAAASAVVLTLEILVALGISVALLDESFTPVSLLGAVAILASILLVSGVEVSGKSLSVTQTNASRVKVSQ